ncbi:MAG TPA: RnfABCDGE type electron transport complex subunit D [Xanthobacteraceae bacterium]|jgi:Na+-transporting NADH:ubiquinone oxidoreductase subunit NqrB|nr:RnfABCDGE type electron transport complex subunit D [Xanthobacteraceae bacterium]
MRRWWSDARHFQIVALSSLLLVNFTWIDFGAKPLYSALAILSALATQIVCARLAGLPSIDLRSPLITGLSLSLLLRADAAWLPALAGIIAIASKFTFRVDGKHIWNPAGFAIVVLLLTQSGVWISPGQWGTSVWLAALLVFFAILVLQAAQRSDIALFFLGSHAALLVARAAWLGDPLAIPLHQLQSGSLLIFAFFMISDPRTAPDSRLGRLLFAFAVAAAGHYLAFFMQMRPALYVALIALSPLTLVLDRIIPAKRFVWIANPQGASR